MGSIRPRLAVVSDRMITIAEAGESGKIERSRLPSPAPTDSDGAKMPPGRPATAVASVARNLAGPNHKGASTPTIIARAAP